MSLVAVACTGSTGEDDQEQPRFFAETATPDPGDLTLDDIRDAADQDDLGTSRNNAIEKSDSGVLIRFSGPATTEVGTSDTIFVTVQNDSENFRPEKPFPFTQTSGQVLSSGPITIDPSDIDGSFTLAPGRATTGQVKFTCNEAGSATITVQSVGQSEIEDPPARYSNTADYQFECVDDDGDPLTGGAFLELTDDALGFSADTLTWVTFDQGGVLLRVSQIEPVELAVGESAEIYADFDARVAADFGLYRSEERLTDGEIDFTSGGPVSVDSPPQRVAQPLAVRGEDGEDPVVFWGFRSGTLTCDGAGEGVYHANLRGKRATGEDVRQTVSGLVDCVEPSDDPGTSVAAELDFSGVWARRPNPEAAYLPTSPEEFPGNTELYFDRQICIARIQGIRACDVAYWVYGTDWFELTKGETEAIVEANGNEVFVTEYTGTYHHTHSYFEQIDFPEDLKRDGKAWGTAWDLGAAPTRFTYALTGTITFSPHLSDSLQISLQGTHQGEMPFTHASKIGMGYTGPIPESGILPVGANFSDVVRQQLQAPEGMFQGSDRAYTGAFYSATVQTNGMIEGKVIPASSAELVDQATVEVFLPGDDTPFASTTTRVDGSFTFRDLPVVRTDGGTTGVSDVYASQYRVVVSDAQSEVFGNTLFFEPRTRYVRPFTDVTIFLEPVPATHFIAVGDREVKGTVVAFHYSLEYWNCGGRFDPLHHAEGFTPDEIVAMCRELNPRAVPQKLGEVELLARMDWNVWAGVDDLTGSGRSWIQEGVWIAEIVYTDTAATELMPIFAGTQEEVETKWAEIIDLAENYPWAEQAGFATGPNFTEWPGSLYDPLGTNSNTFIRFLVTASGLQMTEMDGAHPGHPVPVQNTASDLGRILSLYPEHTPWTGDTPKPEPEGTPP